MIFAFRAHRDDAMLKRKTVKTLLLGMFVFSFLAISGCMHDESISQTLTADASHERHDTSMDSHTVG